MIFFIYIVNYIFRRNRRITQQGLREPSENPNFITTSVVKNQPRKRIKSRFPINIINESESQDIEQQHDSIPILS